MNRIKHLIYVTVVALCSYGYVSACISEIDRHSAGVMLNNYEKIFINRFDSIGTSGKNFDGHCLEIEPSKNVLFKPSTELTSIKTDPVSIDTIKISGNQLEIGVTYGGGCNSHEFNLYIDTVLSKTGVPTTRVELVHDAKGDECKAIIIENLIFNLEPFAKIFSNSSPIILDVFTRESFNSTQAFQKVIWYSHSACSRYYRSHYSPDSAVVNLEFVTIEDGPSQGFPSLRIVTDPQAVFEQPFNYSEAVVTELRWLLDNNIISGITEDQLLRIKESLLTRQGQYWTLQDTLLNYNSYFRYVKDTTGNWSWGAVESSRKNGWCSSTFEFKLPPDTLRADKILSVKKLSHTIPKATFSVNLTDRKCIVTFDKNTNEEGFLQLTDLRGRLIEKIRVPRHTIKSTFKISKISVGMYNLVYTAKGASKVSRIMITE